MKSKRYLLSGLIALVLLIGLIAPQAAEARDIIVNATTTLDMLPATATATTCGFVDVNVRVNDVVNLTAYHLEVTYDRTKVQILEVLNGGFLTDSEALPGLYEPTNTMDDGTGTGRILWGMAQRGVDGDPDPKSGSGNLITIRLKALAGTGTTTLAIDGTTSMLVDWPDAFAIDYTVTGNATVTLQSCAPTDIALSNAVVDENQPVGTVVGTLSATDPDDGDTIFDYDLVSPALYPDNTNFQIVGDELRTNAIFDYETKNSYQILIRVTDPYGLTYAKEFTIAINDVNEAPVLAAIGAKSVVNTGTLTFTATATDEDLPAQTLTFSLANAPTGATIDPATGVFSWTPTVDTDAGTYNATICVSDGELQDCETITITVTDGESPYVLSGVAYGVTPYGNVTADSTLTFTVPQGYVVSTIEFTMSEPVTIVGSNIVYLGTVPYGTMTVLEDVITVAPDAGNEIAALLGTFTFSIEAGSIEDLAGNALTTLSATLVVTDQTPPVMEAVTPAEGLITLGLDDTFILTVDAFDLNLYELEIDHSFEGTLPEFSVYASEATPWGTPEDKAQFDAAGVTITYDDVEQVWTIDFGEAITDTYFIPNGVTFYMVLKDEAGNAWGSMSPTTPENTFAYTFEVTNTLELEIASAPLYEYADGYVYVGDSVFDDPSNTYTNTYSPAEFLAGGAMNDLARYLGALYRQDISTIISIVYAGVTYTWDPEGTLLGSNWVDSSGNTLVSAMVADYLATPGDLVITVGDGWHTSSVTFRLVITNTLDAEIASAPTYVYDPAYIYVGSYAFEDATNIYTVTYDDVEFNPNAMYDLARYLGALYRQDGSTITSIVYAGVTYTWDPEGTLLGSNWVDASGNTLVSKIVDDFEAGLIDPVAGLALTVSDGVHTENVTFKFVILDTIAPIVTISGATADDVAMDGNLEEGYILPTTNDPDLDHLLQIDATVNEPLADEYFGLYFVEDESMVSASELKAYYDARGVPEPYLGFLKGAADGTNPFVYIKGTTVTLVDAAKHFIAGIDVDMTIPDDFPLGTYVVRGNVADDSGNETSVTLKLIVTGDRVAPEIVSGEAIGASGFDTITADGTLTFTVPEGYTVDHIEFTMSEPVQITGSSIVYFEGVPYGTMSAAGAIITVTPYSGNAVASLPGTFTFSIEAGSIKDLAGNALGTLSATLVVQSSPIFNITDFGLWGDSWPGAFNLGWQYVPLFDTLNIARIEVGMLDADRNSIVTYTADEEQVIWQRENGYITAAKLSSAPFYRVYNGNPIVEGRDLDWTVIFGESFDGWSPKWAYVKVTDVHGTVVYHEIEYTGPSADLTAPTIEEAVAIGVAPYGNVTADNLTFTVPQGYTVEKIEFTMSEAVTVVAGTEVTLAGVPYGTITANGTLITVTPYPGNTIANLIGTFTFDVPAGKIFDLSGNPLGTLSATLIVTNVAPVAVNDAYTVAEDGVLTVAARGVLINDTDFDPAILTAVLVSEPANGTLVLKTNGSFTYTPDADFNGTDTFTYKANDGLADSNTATVTITVTPVNDAPVAVNDAYSTSFETAITIDAPGVLGNDSDVDGDSLTAVLVTGVNNGILALNADGSFTYTPNADFSGLDRFTYKANDGTLDSNIATVTITVTSYVNTPPVAVADTYETDQDVQLVVPAPGVLGNDYDVDHDILTATLKTNVTKGTLVLLEDGSFTYTPNPGFCGIDSFVYTLVSYPSINSDGWTADATATITVYCDPIISSEDLEGPFYVGNLQEFHVRLQNPVPGHTYGSLAASVFVDNITMADFSSVEVKHPISGIWVPLVPVVDGTGLRLDVGPVVSVPIVSGLDLTLNFRVNFNTAGDYPVTGTLYDGVIDPTKAIASYSDTMVVAGLEAEDFGYMYSSGVMGVTAGFGNVNFDLSQASEIKVELFSGSNTAYQLLQTNTAISPTVMATWTQFSTPFDIFGTFDYATDGYWTNVRETEYGQTAIPTRVLATVTLPGGITLTAENTMLTGERGYIIDTLDEELASAPEYDYDPPYIPVGDIDFDIDSNTYTGTYTAPQVLAGAPMNDMARYLGALYRQQGSTITSIVYNGTTYTWDTTGTLVGSNWEDSTGKTLVSQVTDDFQAAVAAGTWDPTAGFVMTVHDDYDHSATVTFMMVILNTLDAEIASAPAYVYDPVYIYIGTYAFEDLTNIYTVTYDDTEFAPGAMYDLARYLGALHRQTGATVASIEYDGVIYTWYVPAGETELMGSNWRDASGNTLVSVITAEALAGQIDPAVGITLTLSDVFHTEDVTFRFIINDTTAPEVDTITAFGTEGFADVVAIGTTLTVNQGYTVDYTQIVVNEPVTVAEGTVVTLAGQPYGTITVNATGLILTITPYPGNEIAAMVGSFVFSVPAGSITDLAGNALETLSVTLVVNNVAPVAMDDAYTVLEDTILTVAAPGVLDNDVDYDVLSAILVGDVTNGSLTLNADGSFEYTPDLNWFGTDTFTYKANDGLVDSDPATVTITVTNVKDQVEAVDDEYETNEDLTLTIAAPGVLENDIDVDNNLWTATLVTDVQHGTLSLKGDGSFIYEPDANFIGTDTFEYQLVTYPAPQNLWTDTAIVTITVTPVLDPPVLSTDLPASIYAGYETEFGVTLDNPDFGDSFTGVRVEFRLFDTALTDITSLEYFETATDTWMNLPLTQDGSDVIGWFGPDMGFPMPAPYTATSQFRLTMAVAGTYDYEMHLFDVVAEPDTLLASLSGSVDVLDVEIFNITDFGLWGEVWPGALSLGWQYVTEFDTLDIASIEIGMLDADRDSIIKYTADEAQVAWQRANGYITDPPDKLSSAPFYTEYNGTPIAEGRDFDWTVVFGPEFTAWDPAWGYVKVVDVNGYEEYEEIPYTGTRPDITPPTVSEAVAVGVEPYGDVTAVDMTFSVPQGYTVEKIEFTMSEPVTVAAGTEVTMAGVPYGSIIVDATGLIVTVTPYTGNEVANLIGTFTFSVPAGSVKDLAGHALEEVEATLIVTNVAPVAVDDTYTVAEDGVLTVEARGVLTNDTDFNPVLLTAIKVTDPANGTLVLNADGSFTYTPDADFHGTDTFTYKANDGLADSNVATVTLTVTPVNDAPVAQDQSVTTLEDTELEITLEASDVDGDELTYAIVAEPAHGDVALDGNVATYTPDENYFGADSFTFKANDGLADSNIATVTITISPVNDDPVAMDDAYETDEDTSLIVGAPGVLANDGDVDEDNLASYVLTQPAHGTLTLASDGSFTYVPTPNWHGADTFTYQLVATPAINAPWTDEATVTITVNPVDDAPVLGMIQDATIPELVEFSFTATATDVDLPAQVLTFSLVGAPEGAIITTEGVFTWTPSEEQGPGEFTFTVVVCDDTDPTPLCDQQDVTLTVTEVNAAPVAQDLTATTLEETPVDVILVATDAEDDELTYAIVAQPAHGTVTLVGTTATYTPELDFNGTDTFTYKANDGLVDSNVATVTITITAVNDAPVAIDDEYTVAEKETLTIAAPGVLDNDSDVDGDTLTAILVDTVSNGTLTLNADGSFIYTPNEYFNGTDSFTYKAKDAVLESELAVVTITVAPVNDWPIANDDFYEVVTGTELVKDAAEGILANDVLLDPDEEVSVQILEEPQHGTLSMNDDGSFTYIPDAGFMGTDTFRYMVHSVRVNGVNAEWSDDATVTITVQPLMRLFLPIILR